MNHDEKHQKPKTPTITLRKFTLSDVDAFMSWAADPRVTRFQRRDPYSDPADALAYITTHILPHPWYRAICIDNTPVGSISVKPAPGEDRHRASIGYRLAYDYWGKGIATEALKLTIKAAFEELDHLERLEAIADVDNPASQRVLEKAGFKEEGILRKYVRLKGETRDMVMFSFLVSDAV
ncbi:Acyl-CoA N-acyltransferases (NAT) superfamily protein [Rhynchospora pubera]|uniref:Acyl-CoA N-acyltransferases (NAT) superfamily protein n=1 Tax=Rhynchospora pubera TaxID=906938 RepID=A0AAV8GZ52_9POAL|nr:Acyl-CoA N-acyltransferases (NAT) superfamily protein [Rhynchospora pubera]